MSSLLKHIHTIHDSFYAQKMANLYPSWSRARECKESNVHRLLNSVALYVEDMYKDIRKFSKDKYLSTYDSFLNGVLYNVNIPRRFLFEQAQRGGSIEYFPPTVIATDGENNYELTIVEDLEELYRSLPTRLSLSGLVYSVTDVISNVSVNSLGSVTIGDIPYPNNLYISITGGSEFGTSDQKSFFYPACVTITGLTSKDVVSTEGRIFYCNDIAKTWRIFADVESLEVENVDSSSEIKVDSWGFNRDFLMEEAYSYSRSLDRDPLTLYYVLDDDTESTGNRSWLSYRVRETNTIQLQRQGFSALVEELGLYLLNQDSEHIVLNDIAKLPISEWLFATDDEKLYIYDVFVPSITNTYVLNELNNRTTDPHLSLETYPLSQRLFELNKSVTFATRNKYPISQFSKPTRVRLYIVNSSGTKTYIDKSGSSVSADDSWRYAELRNRGTTKWEEKKWSYSFDTLGAYAVVLETQFLSENKDPVYGRQLTNIEYDVIPVQVGSKTPLKEFTWPASIQPVKGISFDYNGNLWIRSTANGNKARKIDLHFDYALLDYETYTMYVREPYTSIVSIQNSGSFTSNEYV